MPRSLSRLLLPAVALALAVAAAPAVAQFGGGGGQGGGGQGGGGQGGGGGLTSGAAGIVIDAAGVLRSQVIADSGLSAERRRAAVAALPENLQQKAPLRKVALSRLEAEVRRAAATGRGIPDELQKLAGLVRVQYVFIFPAGEGSADAGEVVIAGPAEPWIADSTGRVVGTTTGSPTVLLEDLAAALRAFPPGHPRDCSIGCSIDPTQEGLAAMQTFLRKLGRVNPKAGVGDIVQGMAESLGPQRVRVDGVSPASHFAHVMIEADYRMKLIGIGLERPPVKMNSWIDLTSAGGVAANALQRWYFMPDYQCVRVSEDDLAVELVGRGVKLVGADEAVLPDGTRMSANRADRASRTFTDTFTRRYAEIAVRSPVFSQLRTLVDLAVTAAYLQEHDGYGRARWPADGMLDERTLPIEVYQPPVTVEPAINAVWRGNRLLTPIGGGVTLQPRMALDSPNLLMDEQGTVNKARSEVTIPAGRWWWD